MASGEVRLTKEEKLLRLALRIAAVIFTTETLVYLLPGLFGSAQHDWIQLPFVVNSVVKAAVLGGVCWIAGADVRRFSPVMPVLYLGTFGWVLVGAIVLIGGDTSAHYDLFGVNVWVGAILWGGILFEGALTLLFVFLHRRAVKARYRLEYFSPSQFQTLVALADVLVVGDDEKISPQQVAKNTDRYLAPFHARRKWIMKLALIGLSLYPLLTIRPPLHLMAAEERLEFLKKRFLADVDTRRIRGFRRQLTQGMIRLAQQLAFLGYYSDPKTFESTGYVPFTKRPRFTPAMRHFDHTPVITVPHETIGDVVQADVVVIGSGAAGAIIAASMLENDTTGSRRVLILERGEHVDPRDFSEDEITQISRLYADGALQLSRDFRFQVLQGMCVGGSTVVNNAVCFEIPDPVLAQWNDAHGLRAGLEIDRLKASFAAVRQRLDIRTMPNTNLNPGASRFVEGVEKLRLGQPDSGIKIVEANIASDCFGCGYCNIGCAYGKKLSMLDTVLPQGQTRFGDRMQILAQCHADRLRGSNGRVDSVDCILHDGDEKRKIRVEAKTIVVSGGAIGSSWLLKKSGIGGKQVGENLAFNMGSPVTADFGHEIHSYDGLQISHFLEQPRKGYVFETWFNPVVSQALTMPGWFEDHYRNMRRYANLTAVGVLVGTHRNAKIKRALTGGADVVYTPADEDLSKLIDGIKLAGRVWLAAGAERVMPATFHYREFTSESDLDRLDEYITDSSDLSLGTGHPQGGNALSEDPEKGVVGPDFKVHGMENLYICDASVFPTSITVNPQMTVMALAEYAAPMIA
ncbi:MAG: GMC family oxidoreductase N-terminal domain-containing protein [Solirubrobacterales bacterium]